MATLLEVLEAVGHWDRGVPRVGELENRDAAPDHAFIIIRDARIDDDELVECDPDAQYRSAIAVVDRSNLSVFEGESEPGDPYYEKSTFPGGCFRFPHGRISQDYFPDTWKRGKVDCFAPGRWWPRKFLWSAVFGLRAATGKKNPAVDMIAVAGHAGGDILIHEIRGGRSSRWLNGCSGVRDWGAFFDAGRSAVYSHAAAQRIAGAEKIRYSLPVYLLRLKDVEDYDAIPDGSDFYPTMFPATTRCEFVGIMQDLLNGLLHLVPEAMRPAPLRQDNFFGEKTRKLLLLLQAELGLKPDAICGPLTWGALLEHQVQ